MGLFKETYCSECGAKVGILTRTKLGDKNYLCSNCISEIPIYIINNMGNYSLEQFRKLKDYIIYSEKELSTIFHENHAFYSLHVDTEHEMFYLEDYSTENPLYLKFSNISDFHMGFYAKEFKEGMINDKVIGDISIKLKMKEPYFYCENTIARNVKSKAKKGFISSKIKYENPEEMDEFLLHFSTALEYAMQKNIL